MAGSPKAQGPHWPALSLAIQRVIRAVSAMPQQLSERTTITPAPTLAPKGREPFVE